MHTQRKLCLPIHLFSSIVLSLLLQTERRLGKLEGRVGRKSALTSKDILQSLSEARDDHIMQPRGTDVDRNGPLSSGLSSSGRESPFSIKNEFADVDLGEGGGDGDNVMVVSGRRERVVVEGDVRPAGGSSIWTCCLGIYTSWPCMHNAYLCDFLFHIVELFHILYSTVFFRHLHFSVMTSIWLCVCVCVLQEVGGEGGTDGQQQEVMTEMKKDQDWLTAMN